MGIKGIAIIIGWQILFLVHVIENSVVFFRKNDLPIRDKHRSSIPTADIFHQMEIADSLELKSKLKKIFIIRIIKLIIFYILIILFFLAVKEFFTK